MSPVDPALITDARAFLASFARGDASRLSVRLRGEATLRIQREAPAPTGVPLRAPHVGTLESCKPAGATVESGESLATISVLESRIELPSPASGIIESVAGAPGDLVEFGSVLAWVASGEED